MTVHSLNGRLVAELLSDNVVISQVDDAIDLLGNAGGCICHSDPGKQ